MEMLKLPVPGNVYTLWYALYIRDAGTLSSFRRVFSFSPAFMSFHMGAGCFRADFLDVSLRKRISLFKNSSGSDAVAHRPTPPPLSRCTSSDVHLAPV